MDYNFGRVERKWLKRWDETGLFRAPEEPREARYLLEMFPYPSGDLHVGHLKNYVIGDVVARAAMMEGADVLHPIGWDAFGLPAENAAMKHGVEPRRWTLDNIAQSRETMRRLGLSYDWTRETATCDPSYYRWTQWLFVELMKRGLAYRADAPAKWCPECRTVVANEQVVAGKHERCGAPVAVRRMKQWFFGLTRAFEGKEPYAERLLKGLDALRGRWPDNVVEQQGNWIGRSEGARVAFDCPALGERVEVFTTRADTLFGVTFLVLSPEHPLAAAAAASAGPDAERFVSEALARDEEARREGKRGTATGLTAVHPLSGEALPVWIAEYCLGAYGTGALMGVPAHDARDFSFAREHGLPVAPVIKPPEGAAPEDGAYEGEGVMVNSGAFDGLGSQEGARAVESALVAAGAGRHEVNYRLHDWLVSRQRYWGTPIPVVHCPRCGEVPESELPVLLPDETPPLAGTERSPLDLCEDFVATACPRCNEAARRETDTLDTFVDSSWYFLRYTDPHNDAAAFDPARADAWMPVDTYVGGAEHAVMHLIYARFVNHFLHDLGLVREPEPFARLFTQGLVLMRTPSGDVEMMSKSAGNVVPLGAFVEAHGADVARLTILSAAPPERDFEWTDAGVEGARRLVSRIWNLYADGVPKRPEIDTSALTPAERELYTTLNTTVAAVASDLAAFKFNTAIARVHELVNALYRADEATPVRALCLRELPYIVAPFAPFLAEELHERLGGEGSVFKSDFPPIDERFTQAEEVTVVVQVAGRVRGRFTAGADIGEEHAVEAALALPRVAKALGGKAPSRVVWVPGKLLNLVP